MVPGGPQISANGVSDDSTAQTWFGFNSPSSTLSSITPAKAVFDSVSVILVMIRVGSLPFSFG